MKTLRDWNQYLDDLKRLRDLFYKGTTDESEGLHIDITKEDCNIIWNLLSSKANQVISTPLEFHEPVLPAKQRFIVNGMTYPSAEANGFS